MLTKLFRSIFGITAYLSVVYTLVLCYPIFLLNLDDKTHWLIPKISTLSITEQNTEKPIITESACLQNVLIILIFGTTHSIMASKPYKQFTESFLSKITFSVLSKSTERSMFVLMASVQLYSIMHFYQPMPEIIYEVPENLKNLFAVINLSGLVLLLACTIQLDHLEFLGLKGSLNLPKNWLRFYPIGGLVEDYLYGMIRHPLMTAQFIMFWIHPVFTVGHFVLAAGGTIYALIAVYFLEEPRMLKQFPKSWPGYKNRVPAFCPMMRMDKNSDKIE